MADSIRTKVLKDALEGEITRQIQAEVGIELQRSMNIITTDPGIAANRDAEIVKLGKGKAVIDKVVSILQHKLDE